jgi:zinc transport system substrate-binding protein
MNHQPKNRQRAATSLLAILGMTFFSGAALSAEPPKVLTSIKPIHSLVASVMRGVAEPGLLVKGAASPHAFSLRPSDARALDQADLVFWMGEDLETFLEKPIESLGKKAHVVPLMDAPRVKLLPTREGGAWEPHVHEEGEENEEHAEAGHDHDHGHDHHDHGGKDAHVWLDVANARAMVAAISAELVEHDAANADRYKANAKDLTERLTALDAELRTTLQPVKDRPYVVFHDAYHYVEARYGLNAVGAITVSPDQRPSAQRLSQLRAKITSLDATCVFAEPQFEPTLVGTVVEGTKARKGVLDPLGADLPDGPDLYFQLMRGLAGSLVSCLKAG